MEELTADATCETGSAEVETAGTDPTFQVRPRIWDAEYDTALAGQLFLPAGSIDAV
mgnify:CR=1 FL=1